MSLTSTADDASLQTISSPPFSHTFESVYHYAVNHVFFPIYLPGFSRDTPENNHSLARAVCAAAHAYTTYVCGTTEQAQWHRITKMLDNLEAFVQSKYYVDTDHVISQLQGMKIGGMFAYSL